MTFSLFFVEVKLENLFLTCLKKSATNPWNNSNFSYSDPKSGIVYTVKFDIQVELAEGKPAVSKKPLGAYNPFNTNNYVEVNNSKLEKRFNEAGTAGVTIWGDEGLFGTSKQAFVKAVPHEVGHMLGLDHHYLKHGGDEPGWENNVMGNLDGNDGKSGAGDVEQRNVDDLVAPSVRNFNDKKERAEAKNRMRKTMIKGGARFVPPPAIVPTSYEAKLDNYKMDQ